MIDQQAEIVHSSMSNQYSKIKYLNKFKSIQIYKDFYKNVQIPEYLYLLLWAQLLQISFPIHHCKQ